MIKESHRDGLISTYVAVANCVPNQVLFRQLLTKRKTYGMIYVRAEFNILYRVSTWLEALAWDGFTPYRFIA